MTLPVTFSMTRATWSISKIIGFANSPSAAAPRPKKIAKTTICSISLPANAAKIEVGTRWVTNSLMEKEAVFRLLEAVTSGKRQPDILSRSQNGDHDQSKSQRHQGRRNEPTHRFHADPPDGLRVTHMRDPDDQRRKHQRGDDHLDQSEK